MTVRVDVVSLKGGAGKTTVAFRLAWAQARSTGRPALLVDADFAGACLGDLLERWVVWGEQPNLTDRVCDRPENLAEDLARGDRFPVYRLRVAPPTSGPEAPSVVTGPAGGASVLFCPSHGSSLAPHTTPTLLHALVAHESAGKWVQHVVDMVIERTGDLAGPLGGVVVDHSPGLSALPWAVLQGIVDAKGEDRKVCFLTTPDLVDLKAWFAARASPRLTNVLDALERDRCAAWVMNRLPPIAIAGRDDIRSRLPEDAPEGTWLDSAFGLPHDEKLADAYRRGGLVQLVEQMDPEIEPLRRSLFEGTP